MVAAAEKRPSTWAIVARSAADALEPDPVLTVSDWADRYRRLDTKSSAEPGRWRTDRTPYLRDIMDSMSPRDPCTQVVFMAGVQLGKTECIINCGGYSIDVAPGPIMLVQPTVDLARRFSRQRIEPLIENTPRVGNKISEKRSRDAQNTIFAKDFPGGVLQLVGANSAVGLRSMPARYLYFDEVDGYPMDVDGEGDPIALAERRTSTFSRRKILKVSTPTTEGLSRIAEEYEASDQRQYWVPCPECNTYQLIEWGRINYELDSDKQPIPETIGLGCEACGALIPEHAKTQMLARGKWVPRFPDRPVRGFHLSSLYSPYGWFSWHAAIVEFLKTEKNTAKLRTFINTILAETWKEQGDAPEWERLYLRRETYKVSRVPAMLEVAEAKLRGPVVLTAGVDVQRDRLELEIVAWGPRMESWCIDYRVISGDPAGKEVWNELDELLAESFRGEGGRALQIQRLAIDSGDGMTVTPVYRWGGRQDVRRVMVCKGGPDSIRQVVTQPKLVDVDRKGKRIARGVKVWITGAGHCKGELYSWLKAAQPTDPGADHPVGWCHFPELSDEYFKQLTAEKLAWRVVRGYRRPEWTKTRERNEALDCRVLARVAAYAIGVDRWGPKRWMREFSATLCEEPTPAAPRVKRKRERRGGGYLDGFSGGL